ncbi:MAG TPA: hypothetical protein PK264_01360, partial [Hyphomicrobiaceae bacterium]|nr:hypothetical protein [Hyphomicrobiaceae bacterium]
MTHDAAGNTLTKSGGLPSIALAWDAENKLAVANVGADLVTVFLGGGVEIDGAGTWTKYLHEEQVHLRECSGSLCQCSLTELERLRPILVCVDDCNEAS